jgi:2-hydroxymuconate-semialdehyde hydrolase
MMDATYLETAGDPRGEALLFLHGTGPGATAVASFQSLLPGLTRYRCLLPDLLGFGRSSHPDTVPPGPGPWFARRVAAVRTMLDELGVGRVHLVGHSYGARVALELVIREPDRFARVVLLSAGGTPVRANLSKLTGFYRSPSKEAMRDLVHAQLSHGPVPGIDDYIRERYAVATRPEVRRSFESAMAPGEPAPTYEASALAAIGHHVLAVHGADDATISPTASLYLAEHLAHCDMHLFADCGHLSQFEVPTRLSALIREFLAAA